MFTHKGTQTINTARLTLRRIAPDDAPAMYRNWASDPEVTKYLTWPPHASVDATRALLESWSEGYADEKNYLWAICARDGGEPFGTISVVRLDEQIGEFEIGYCIGKAWWHKGYMTEALGAVIDYLFREVGALRISARHDPNNPHSGGVMRKCGMTYEGTNRRAGHNNQGICDVAVYAILRDEYNF